MTMIHYADLKIKILADQEEVNGPDEILLSDDIDEIEREVEAWLADMFHKFEFEIQGG